MHLLSNPLWLGAAALLVAGLGALLALVPGGGNDGTQAPAPHIATGTVTRDAVPPAMPAGQPPDADSAVTGEAEPSTAAILSESFETAPDDPSPTASVDSSTGPAADAGTAPAAAAPAVSPVPPAAGGVPKAGAVPKSKPAPAAEAATATARSPVPSAGGQPAKDAPQPVVKKLPPLKVKKPVEARPARRGADSDVSLITVLLKYVKSDGSKGQAPAASDDTPPPER